MPITDIVIVILITVSVGIGIYRGFVKEAISITALLVAIWAALYFGPAVGGVSESWIASRDLQMWFGRILVFAVILSIGGLLGWGISKLVRLSVLSGMDRLAGAVFGAARGILLVALLVLAGEFAGFGNDAWWQRSIFIPHLEAVAEWITIMAPQGYEILVPDEELI
ncbi:MAG: CvpA family protein [Woeseiaceae bacterium]|nr:CvpA family protein [Woeseiaceae bacterium]NIP22075.1 CvpA family protein [Woeseiaceae bacterium]NIS91189.1 CvpA family protein [Woeseiaceae bacterium]